MYSSPDIVKLVKLRRMRCVGACGTHDVEAALLNTVSNKAVGL